MTSGRGAIGVVEYGVGNTGSIRNMLTFLNVPHTNVTSVDDLPRVSRIILPGVGAFDYGMTRLKETGALDTVMAAAAARLPILGICLGMQLLTDGSAEGTLPGLGLVPGYCERLPADGQRVKVPHMGWNAVTGDGRQCSDPRAGTR